MSHELAVCLVAVAINLIAMTIIYSALSCALARRGTVAAVLLILVSQLFWIAPAIWIVEAQGASRAGSYALWFGNWIVGAFAIVLLGKTVSHIPAAIFDTAQMDGLTGLTGWRRTVLPFVGRHLLILAFFTLMATLLPFWGVNNQPDAANVITIFQRSSTMMQHLLSMAAGSLIGSIPLIAIFFLEGRAMSRP